MKSRLMTAVPTGNVIAYGICLGALVIFTVGIIFPNFKTISHLYMEGKRIHQEIETQKILYPLYQKVKMRYTAIQPLDARRLPAPVKLDVADSANLITEIEAACASAGYTDITVNLNLGLIGQAETVPVTTSAKGDVRHLRDLLKSLNHLPYLKQIDLIVAEQETAAQKELITIRFPVLSVSPETKKTTG